MNSEDHFKEIEDIDTLHDFDETGTWSGVPFGFGETDKDDSRQIHFSDCYDDYSESEFYAGAPEDFSLHSLLTVDNARFWSFDPIFEALGLAEPEDSIDYDILISSIESLFRQAVLFFDDDVTALIRACDVPITDPLLDAVDDDALEVAKDLRIFFFVDDPQETRKLIVPLELRGIFAEISAAKDFDDKRRINAQLVYYAQGMTILNGIVLVEDLARCLERNTGLSLPAEAIETFLRSLSPFYDLLGFRYNLHAKSITHAALTSRSDITDLWSISQTHPAYLPDAESLRMARLNAFYPMTEEYRRFEEYVSQWHFFDDESACALFLIDFGQAISMGAPIQELSSLCDDYDMDIGDEFDKFMSLTTDVMNTTRRWDLRGNTIDELRKVRA